MQLLDLNYDRLRRAIAGFGRLAEDADQAVLYYAGHGIEVAGQNYLIPIDARLQHAKDVEFETASLNQVLGAVEDGSGLRIIILDACRDNPFRSRMITTRTVSRGLQSVEPPTNNILVAYSSKHGTVALDGHEDNSPYAIALLDHLERPGLEISDFFREVQDAVLEATGRRQEPRIYGSLGRRKYYFIPPQQPMSASIVGLTSQIDANVIAHTYWSDLRDSSDPADFEEFIVRFADSHYVPLAKRNSERLIKECTKSGAVEGSSGELSE